MHKCMKRFRCYPLIFSHERKTRRVQNEGKTMEGDFSRGEFFREAKSFSNHETTVEEFQFHTDI